MTSQQKTARIWFAFALIGIAISMGWFLKRTATAQQPDIYETRRLEIMAQQEADAQITTLQQPMSAMPATPCIGGFAGSHACLNTDLMAFMPLSAFSAGSSNDVQGWTDPLDGKEYAVLGLNNGTAFIDISDPENPVYLGKLPGHNGTSSTWRELDVMGNYAYIVSEAGGHGMQIFDLTELRNVANPPVTFAETDHYNSFGSAHSIGGNPATNFMYAMGSNTCAGGLHMVNVADPLNPVNAGCYSGDGYSHDAQCIVYDGPDTPYLGHEICFNSNEDTITIVDVTNKAAPVMLSRTSYAGVGYTHQTAITADHTYFLMDDELDELNSGHNSRTRIWNASDLDAPVLIDFYDGPYPNIDHNIYIRDGYAYEANYTSGLQIFDLADVANGNLTMIAYFDSYLPDNSASFNGAWAVFPYFDSGLVLITGIDEGMYIVRPTFTPQFYLSSENTEFSFCSTGSESTLLDIVDQNGYIGTVTLSSPDLPAGTLANFDPNPVIAPGSSMMTITVSTTPTGIYPFTILGADGVVSDTLNATLSVFTAPPGAASLISPTNGATEVPLQPTFTWTGDAPSYMIEIATDEGFTNIVDTASVSDTTYTPSVSLLGNTTYYWRVITSNACGNGTASETFSFETVNINTVCNDNAINIPDSGASSLYPSNITLTGEENSLTDVNVHLLDLSHTNPDDVDILLVGPQGQTLILMSDAGGSGDVNLVDLVLDDSAASLLPNSSTLTAGAYRPANYGAGDSFPAPAPTPSGSTTLAVFNNTDPNGTWSLYVVDDQASNSGSLSSGWCLEFSSTNATTPTPTPSPTNTPTPTPTLTPTPPPTAEHKVHLPLITR